MAGKQTQDTTIADKNTLHNTSNLSLDESLMSLSRQPANAKAASQG